MRHMRTIGRGLAAMTAIAGLVVAVPAGLITQIGWPLPRTIPTLDRIQLALRSGIDPTVIIHTLAIVTWIVWAQLVFAVAAEILAAVRGRTVRRLPVLPGLQPAVTQLVAAITLAVVTLGPQRADPADAAPLPHILIDRPVATAPLEDPSPMATVVTETTRHRTADTRSYKVTRRDTLWRIAESTMGDGRRWKEIRDLNLGRTMPDGSLFAEGTDRLQLGWILSLPLDATVSDTETTDELTVEEGDSFWTIASQALATAWDRTPTDAETSEYWLTVIDANRNRLASPGDPDLIYPGQRFQIPPIPTPGLSGAESTPPAEVTVRSGDNFWSIAHHTLTATWHREPTNAELGDYWRRLVDLNRDRLDDATDPDLIHPGQTFRLPTTPTDSRLDTTPEPALDADPEPPETTSDSPDAPISTVEPEPQPVLTIPDTVQGQPTLEKPTEHAETEPSPTVIGIEDEDTADESLVGEMLPVASRLAGLGLLAAGLLALLRRLRRNQIRHRLPDTTPTAPPSHTATVESTIRAAAAPTTTEFTDLALRSLARIIVDSHAPPPQLVGVHLDNVELRVLLWSSHTQPPSGWSIDDDGRSWKLPLTTDSDKLRNQAAGVPAPYPALATVGHGEGTQLLLNLEHLGATQLTGKTRDVVATLYTMATELAASPLADDLNIVCVGFGADLAYLDRVTVVDRITEMLPTLEAKAAAVTRLRSPSPLQGRLSPAGGDTWNPIIVLDPSDQPSETGQRLLRIAHAGRGVAAVVGYPTGDRWRLHVEDDQVRIEPLGLTLARRNLTQHEQTALADLVTAALDLEGLPTEGTADPLTVALKTEQAPEAEVEEPGLPVDDEPGRPEFPGPEMKVLGTIQVDGMSGRFPLRRCTELVAYLTFHRGGVEADTLMEALWPDQAPDYQRLNSHTSRARTTLGSGPDGEAYLPYVRDGIYRLSPHFHSDIERFTDHIRRADEAEGADQPRHLRAALDLVTGTPFTGVGNAYTWAHTGGIITHSIVAIDNAAHRLAQQALADDDPELATWASRKGLVATEACERCYRNLMRAALSEDNQVALEAIYTELLAVTDSDDGPGATDYLDPETIDLYEQANRGRKRHVG